MTMCTHSRLLFVVLCLTVVLSSTLTYLLFSWLTLPRELGLTQSTGNYRRTGPETGPQVFCAGSSLLI